MTMAVPASGKWPGIRLPAKDRRRQIVNVAAELFSRRGFSGTTTKEIADSAHVSEAIIFRHFPTKHALYSAIIDHKTRQMRDSLQADLQEAQDRKDDCAFFGSLAVDLLEVHLNDPTIMRLLMFSALEGHELSELFFQQTARKMRDRVRNYIKQRIADGAFREVDPNVTARAFVGMIMFHAEVRILYKDSQGDDVKLSNKEIADRLVDLFLTGIRKNDFAA
jgi:AcrR family transcriptional regulator